jgi:hypothetical protein
MLRWLASGLSYFIGECVSLFRKELQNVLNPAYGSALIYCLARGYKAGSDSKNSIPLPIVFLALPLLLDPIVIGTIRQTRLGLRAMADKLTTNPMAGSDLLLSMPSKVAMTREFTLSCVLVLLSAKLASLDLQNGTLAIEQEESFRKNLELPQDVKEAEKLGTWLAKLSLFEISSALKVAL